MTDAIIVEDLQKRFGSVVALDGVELRRADRHRARAARPERRGQDHRRCACSPRSCGRTRAGPRCSASTSTRDPQAVRERIGLAGQYAAVDENLTGHENLRMVGRLSHLVEAGRARPRRRAARALRARRRRRPPGAHLLRRHAAPARPRGRARAPPPVLFLDEPTTGLDPSGRQDLWGVIEELVREGTTLLLTTQYLEEADRLADNIVVIDHGQRDRRGHVVGAQGDAGRDDRRGRLRRSRPPRNGRRPSSRASGCATSVPPRRIVELKVDDGARVVLDVVRALDHAHLEPVTLTVREPTLDDVFLSLTGHKAEEPEAEDEPADAGRRRTRGAA